MFYVYLLRSQRDGDFYIGYTDDLRRRFSEHNQKRVASTKNRAPFALIYYEAYRSEDDAREREHNLKLRANALNQLKRRIARSLKTH